MIARSSQLVAEGVRGLLAAVRHFHLGGLDCIRAVACIGFAGKCTGRGRTQPGSRRNATRRNFLAQTLFLRRDGQMPYCEVAHKIV